MFLASVAIQEVTFLIFNYAKLPTHLRNNFIIVITHPVYKLTDAAFGTLSFLRAITKNIPGLRYSPSIATRLEHKQLVPPETLLSSVLLTVH